MTSAVGVRVGRREAIGWIRSEMKVRRPRRRVWGCARSGLIAARAIGGQRPPRKQRFGSFKGRRAIGCGGRTIGRYRRGARRRSWGPFATPRTSRTGPMCRWSKARAAHEAQASERA